MFAACRCISVKRDLISIKRDLISVKRDLQHLSFGDVGTAGACSPHAGVCVCVCVCVLYIYICRATRQRRPCTRKWSLSEELIYHTKHTGRPDRGGRVQGSGVSLSSRASALAVRRRRIYAAKAVQKVDAEPRVEEEQGEGFKTGGAKSGGGAGGGIQNRRSQEGRRRRGRDSKQEEQEQAFDLV